MTDVKKELSEISKELEPAIRAYIEDDVPANLIEACRQYPYAGGKRMRPAMTVTACGAVGGNREDAVPLAVAIEYIHNFTLVHDDMMDGDEMRRGMPTSHAKYGPQTAMLAGDALFAKAFNIISKMDVPPEVSKKIMGKVSEAVWDLARGQQMDVNNENAGTDVGMDDYIETIRLKTGVLFAAGAECGALVGGADDATAEAVYNYAEAMGVAFQMFDDILGIYGDSGKTGKSSGNDIRKGKTTVMICHFLKQNRGGPEFHRLRSILGKADASDAEIDEVRKMLKDSGSYDFALRMAKEYVDAAKSELDCLPAGREKDFMAALAEYAMDRDV